MKRTDWRRVRGTDFGPPPGHPLATKPVHEVIDSAMSEVMWEVLRRIATHEHRTGLPITGEGLSGYNTKPSTVEALWFRDFVKVSWARVPAFAPMHIRIQTVALTERGRAALAIVDLRREEDPTWTVPPGVTAVSVSAVGGGGGGAAGNGAGNASSGAGYGGAGGGGGGAHTTAAQVAAHINRTQPGVTASVVGPNGIVIGAAKTGPVGKPTKVTSPQQLAAVFGKRTTVLLPVRPGEEVNITIGAGGAGSRAKGRKNGK